VRALARGSVDLTSDLGEEHLALAERDFLPINTQAIQADLISISVLSIICRSRASIEEWRKEGRGLTSCRPRARWHRRPLAFRGSQRTWRMIW
jgi:hypothetical protein